MKKVLYICVQDPDLKEMYNEKIQVHNLKCDNDEFMDSGFDLYVPQEYDMENKGCYFIDLKITCAMFQSNSDFRLREYTNPLYFMEHSPKAFYLYPRSSISKTSFRLANNVGIIDKGYRGNIGAYFDVIVDNVSMKKYQRLLQICSNDLEPFYVVMVDQADFMLTSRGSGGFGSTGQ